jgi:hypothetical protein
MLDPAIDSDSEPFSYFWHPTDVIGALYSPVASEVTPEGYIFTGFGELMFFIGNPLQPVNKRIKTLYKGYLPIVQYEVSQHGVRYNFTMFASSLGGDLGDMPLNFVKVEVSNQGQESRAAFLSSAYRFTGPTNKLVGMADYRFEQRFDLIPAKYTEGQVKFNPDWKYAFTQNGLSRNGRILYLFSSDPRPHQASLALEDTGLRALRYFSGEVTVNPDPKHTLDPHTPMGVATYRIRLHPGESRSLVFKMPLVPVQESSPEARQIDAAEYERHFASTISTWEQLAGRARLRFPEEKVQHYLLANTVYDLLAIDKVGNDYIPNVNKFQYHRYYGGSDTAHMLIGLDYMGLEDIARKALVYSRTAQAPDGAFIVPGREYKLYETFGCALWSLGRHYLLTRDKSFLQEVYPSVPRAMDWLKGMTEKDALGLLPPVSIGDDAMLANVRHTGQNMWILIGLKNALRMAQAMGKADDIERISREYDRFWKVFERQLSLQTAKSNGYIPPALEKTLLGNNWDNLLTLYPELLFEPFDPRVTATIQQSRKTYVEGILDYVRERPIAREDWPVDLEELAVNARRGQGFIFDPKPHLHYWHTPDNAQNHLVRGSEEDQALAVRDLYSLLLHTTSTHAPQEWGTDPWSTRDQLVHNLIPDGPASGKTIELLRNMLVREYKNDLYFFSALSPAWLQPGKKIEVINSATEFGPVSAELKVNSSLAHWNLEIRLEHQFRQAPERVIIRIPWFFEAEQIEADGQAVKAQNGLIVLSPNARTVKVRGRVKPGTREMNFDNTVQDYKREYRARYNDFLRTGVVQP